MRAFFFNLHALQVPAWSVRGHSGKINRDFCQVKDKFRIVRRRNEFSLDDCDGSIGDFLRSRDEVLFSSVER